MLDAVRSIGLSEVPAAAVAQRSVTGASSGQAQLYSTYI